jgi:uncharacterized PurR-regulated membrane protein YhhQ (DUF165 family)
MSKYKDLFFPTSNAVYEINESTVFIAMVVVAALSIIYIMFGIKHLMLIFRNRDHSFRQNFHIVFKIFIMSFLAYIVYEIVTIIIEIGQ